MQPDRQVLELAWGEVSYLEWQPASEPVGPDVLLLHGGGLDSAWLSWGELGSQLADAGYRVIAPDHPGYGYSPPAPWTSTQLRLVTYVAELVDALNLRNYVIGGISLGGGLTIGHLLARPGVATGAILLGSYGLMDWQFEGLLTRPTHHLTWALLHTRVLDAVMRLFAKDRSKLELTVGNLVRDRSRMTPELLDVICSDAAAGTALRTFAQWQRAEFGWNRLKTNYTGQLHTITTPTLIVHGSHDIGVPVKHARLAAELLPNARLLVVENAAHWVQRDRPEEVIPAALEFLTELG